MYDQIRYLVAIVESFYCEDLFPHRSAVVPMLTVVMCVEGTVKELIATSLVSDQLQLQSPL